MNFTNFYQQFIKSFGKIATLFTLILKIILSTYVFPRIDGFNYVINLDGKKMVNNNSGKKVKNLIKVKNIP